MFTILLLTLIFFKVILNTKYAIFLIMFIMSYAIYKIDAFTDDLFKGNPAAVCPLLSWPEADVMQKIAMENNLAETAFYVKGEKCIEIRWFTPTVEVDLCGHATLAAAFVLFRFDGYIGNEINFYSIRSGALPVRKEGDFITLNFPADVYNEIEPTELMYKAFDHMPVAVLKGKTDYLFVFETEEQIQSITPDLQTISELDSRGVIITAPSAEVDFVSRFFAPQSGIPEDPVTGSAHTTLTPYWQKKLNKNILTAKQLSKRGGFLKCRFLGQRVEISGQARLFLKGEIFI